MVLLLHLPCSFIHCVTWFFRAIVVVGVVICFDCRNCSVASRLCSIYAPPHPTTTSNSLHLRFPLTQYYIHFKLIIIFYAAHLTVKFHSLFNFEPLVSVMLLHDIHTHICTHTQYTFIHYIHSQTYLITTMYTHHMYYTRQSIFYNFS